MGGKMKFGKKYKLEMEGQDQKKVPGIGYEELKKILKNCRRDLDQSQNDPDHGVPNGISTCPVCDGVFFQTLLKEMSAVIRCFNERVKKLIERHHSSGFHKYFIRLKDKLQGNQIDLIREGKDLITYALINTMAMRKLLKKYDEIHFSKQGQAFKSQAQSRHIEILQSPWLYELMAFHVNLRKAPVLFEGCSVICKPLLSCDLFDSVKLAIDLTCPVCLDTVFDAVCLTCGHIFCHMCACKAASVTIVDGMKAADPKEKCPLCREEGVYEGAVHLEELNILLSSSCPEYWDERLQMERVDRVQQAKEHWESQCRAFMGV